MTVNKTLIQQMFDAENFRSTGHALIDLLTAELQRSMKAERPVLHWQPPEVADRAWQAPLPWQSTLNIAGLLKKLESDILPRTLAIQIPRQTNIKVLVRVSKR